MASMAEHPEAVVAEQSGESVQRGSIVHACPPEGSGIMPCCGRTPFEARTDRVTLDAKQVTCLGGWLDD